jgi:hypothetical protein
VIPPGPIAKPLHDALDAESYRIVCEYLCDVAADCALETDDERVIAPSVAWLAETLTFYPTGGNTDD